MLLPLRLTGLAIPSQLTDLFAEPMGFLAVWLLFGWLLLRPMRQAPPTENPAVIDHHHRREADARQHRGLELVLLGIALYVLARYWHNRSSTNIGVSLDRFNRR